MEVNCSFRSKASVNPVDVIDALLKSFGWGERAGFELFVENGLLTLYRDDSHHGSPDFQPVETNPNPSDAKAYEALNFLREYLTKKELNNG